MSLGVQEVRMVGTAVVSLFSRDHKSTENAIVNKIKVY